MTKQSLWVNSCLKPPLVQKDLRRRLHVPKLKSPELENGSQSKKYSRSERGQQQNNHHASTNITALLASLKACAKSKNLSQGRLIHSEIIHTGLLRINVLVGNSLINMYAKCGALTKAHEVFDEIPSKDVFSWTILIAGYVQQGYGTEALYLFEEMQREGKCPNAVTFSCIVKSCGRVKDIEKGKEIHAEIVRQGLLEENVVLGTALVDMYSKCGDLVKTQEVFNTLAVRNIVSWNALMTGYLEIGNGVAVLKYFQQMQSENLSLDTVTFGCLFKACRMTREVDKGKELHVEVARLGLLKKCSSLGTAVLDMYAKCGKLALAKEVLDELSTRDVVSWTALIGGYVEHGYNAEALNSFECMQQEGHPPNEVTYTLVLKSCGSLLAIGKGKEIHDTIAKKKLLERSSMLGCALVDMYAKCGSVDKAKEVFDNLFVKNVGTWNALIAGYCNQGLGKVAINCFEEMQSQDICPDVVTYASVLNACGSTGEVKKGRQIHDKIVSEGLLGNDCVVGTATVDMYARCGALAKAQEVFNDMSDRNVVTWTALICGYAKHGNREKALHCFKQMQSEGFMPNETTIACMLKVCSTTGAAEMAKEIHVEILRNKLLLHNKVIGTALVDMYARSGALATAHQVFDELPIQDVVPWTALITGYCQHERGEEALDCFERMQLEGAPPNAMTFASMLKVCGTLGAAEKGKEIHAQIVREGLLIEDGVLATALVDMYVKFGTIMLAHQVFDDLPVKNGVSLWNALFAGHAQLGNHIMAFNLFSRMIAEGIEPDAVTLIVMLKVCSHSGLVDAGNLCFELISKIYGIVPTMEHLTCMVGMFGRAGHFDKAINVISKVTPDYLPIWFALLGACKKSGNRSLGRLAFEQAITIDKKSAIAYVYMGDIYGTDDRQLGKIESMRNKNK